MMAVIGSSELPHSGSGPSFLQLMAPRHSFKSFGEVSRLILTLRKTLTMSTAIFSPKATCRGDNDPI